VREDGKFERECYEEKNWIVLIGQKNVRELREVSRR